MLHKTLNPNLTLKYNYYNIMNILDIHKYLALSNQCKEYQSSFHYFHHFIPVMKTSHNISKVNIVF